MVNILSSRYPHDVRHLKIDLIDLAVTSSLTNRISKEFKSIFYILWY